MLPPPSSRMAPRPAGLKNVGNTCYVNSLLQSYYALPPFRAAVVTARLRDVTLEGGVAANDLQQRQNSLYCTCAPVHVEAPQWCSADALLRAGVRFAGRGRQSCVSCSV
jgi:uncharacterized UBP type Zn finger protein